MREAPARCGMIVNEIALWNREVTLSSSHIPLRRVSSLRDDSQFEHDHLRRQHRLLRVADIFIDPN